MLTRLAARVAMRAMAALSTRLAQVRRDPDAGMETVDKILWVAATIVIVGTVGMIFKNKLEAFANSLNITLGF